MTPPVVELVYVDGCPHADSARRRLREALVEAGLAPHWTEWDVLAVGTPAWYWGYPSPTVLVGGHDVLGEGELAGPCCRVDGPPPAAMIARALTQPHPRRRTS